MGKSYSSAREALFLNGSFVVEYLRELDAKSSDSQGLAETPVASAILKEVGIRYSPWLGLPCSNPCSAEVAHTPG